jgi:hypothetical protein
MFDLTSTAVAPWYVIPAEYKRFARIAVAKTAVKTLAKAITIAPPAVDPEVKLATQVLGSKELVRRFQNCARIGQTGRSSL